MCLFLKRADKPDAISWMLKHHPEVSDAELCRLLGTTSPTINAIRNKTHWNSVNLKSRSPVSLGLCTQEELNQVIEAAKPLVVQTAFKSRRFCLTSSRG